MSWGAACLLAVRWMNGAVTVREFEQMSAGEQAVIVAAWRRWKGD